MRLYLLAAIATLHLTACSGFGQDRPWPRPRPEVRNGIDVLRAEKFARLENRKVGLITNHTGLALDGAGTAELLHTAKNVTLVALFSPEHGFHGKGEGKIADAKHGPTGLPIYSLYTKERAPNEAHLKGIDTLVFDIQDIGCRFYTYISTMGEAMQVASEARASAFVVLDRVEPDPAASRSAGPMRDADAASLRRLA